ncbi:hypothetical protein LOK49_LG02G00899 [Camellia lanceoleosa]|uniref:Uncharacterized protein n=1 Tax=Camellia lanceoleosa TaxID=1840588 RepID=A0ACC0IM02_9ERIC|nr:hypothetical protein LOK49_LG02G00899 [Camellia lanceoleosa]
MFRQITTRISPDPPSPLAAEPQARLFSTDLPAASTADRLSWRRGESDLTSNPEDPLAFMTLVLRPHLRSPPSSLSTLFFPTHLSFPPKRSVIETLLISC